ncbi:hypothetical protein [Glaciihabitans sp. dw_435]|uniref:hypothetical protein n=1 Tax=Glaciihabitans sp. dw_435 TaxID=2720081 RepID=UPI001BD33A78|nr:hypothetical protein [Glaciihabitans sp. dw_435]
MVITSRASLVVFGQDDSHTAARVTELMGLIPHDGGELGEFKRPPRIQPDGTVARRFVYKQATWILDAPEDVDHDDESGFASVRRLLDLVRPAKHAFAQLVAENYDVRLLWSGDSDSSQGGFVIPADLIADLARMKCDLFGTVYISESDDD